MGLEDSLPSEGRRGRPASEGRRRCRRRRRRPRGPARGSRDASGGQSRGCPTGGRGAARSPARSGARHRRSPTRRRGAGSRRRRVHDMPLGGRRVRRDGQHGAEAEGRLRAQAQVGAGRGGPALGVRGASRGRLRGRDARARRARPDAGVRGARPRRWGRGAAGGVTPRGQPNRVRGTRRAESGSSARRVGGACPSDSSRRPATNPTPAGTCAGGPFRCLPPVSIAAETRYAVKVFR